MNTTEPGAEELLTTTRAIRRRLDLEREVPLKLIRECIEIALQAPTGGNAQSWHFIVIRDAARRAALAELYRRAWAGYRKARGSVYELAAQESPGPRRAQLARVAASADFLVDNLHRVPIHMIPCIRGRVGQISGPPASIAYASTYGSILPATWSYMLAGRARGLGTTWTTAHLAFEEDAATLLGIPYEDVTQVALVPTAFMTGTALRRALRRPVDEVMHLDGW